MEPARKEIFKERKDLLFSPLRHDGIQKFQADYISVLIMDLRLREHIGRKDASFFQFQDDAVPVFAQERFRRILSRQGVLFLDLHIDRNF